MLFFGDARANGISGTALNGVAVKLEIFAPPIYNDAPFVLHPGVYTTQTGGVVTLTAVPEPEAWALLIAGAALTGGALRGARRRRWRNTKRT